MVDRYEITEKTLATVVDLDGTYIDGNTLKLYIKCGMARCFRSGHVFKAISVALLLMARRLRLVSHIAMKARVLSALEKERPFMQKFITEVFRRINKDVVALIEKNRVQGHRVLLATAAPEFYVKEFWKGDYIATADCCSNDQIECRGEEKLYRVKEWLEANNCVLHTVITDHKDDIPLVRFNKSGINVLVKPDATSLSLFRKLEPSHLFLIEDVDKLSVSR